MKQTTRRVIAFLSRSSYLLSGLSDYMFLCLGLCDLIERKATSPSGAPLGPHRSPEPLTSFSPLIGCRSTADQSGAWNVVPLTSSSPRSDGRRPIGRQFRGRISARHLTSSSPIGPWLAVDLLSSQPGRILVRFFWFSIRERTVSRSLKIPTIISRYRVGPDIYCTRVSNRYDYLSVFVGVFNDALSIKSITGSIYLVSTTIPSSSGRAVRFTFPFSFACILFFSTSCYCCWFPADRRLTLGTKWRERERERERKRRTFPTLIASETKRRTLAFCFDTVLPSLT